MLTVIMERITFMDNTSKNYLCSNKCEINYVLKDMHIPHKIVTVIGCGGL